MSIFELILTSMSDQKKLLKYVSEYWKTQLKEYKISNFSWEQSLALQEGHVDLQHTMLATQTQCLYKLSTQFRSYIYYISY